MEYKFTVRDYVAVFFRRKNVFLAFFISLVCIVMTASFALRPVFRAEAVLLVERAEEEPLVSVKRSISDFVDRIALVTTQVEFITSRRILEKVVRDFSLDKNLPIRGAHKFEKALIFLKKNVKVAPVKNTDFIRIRLDLKDKLLVSPVVNAIARDYVDFYFKLKEEHSAEVVGFIDSQIDVIKRKLNDAEIALRDYEESANAVAIDEEAKIWLGKLADEENRLVQLSQDYSDLHPDVIAAKAKISGIKEKLKALPSRKLELKRLEYAVENFKSVYLPLLKKKEEMRIASEMETGRIGNIRNIQIIDSAIEPIKPVWPKKRLNLLLAVFLGFFGGIGLSFCVDCLDQRLYSREDVEKHFDISVAGTIPELKGMNCLPFKPAYDNVEYYHRLWREIKALSSSAARTILVTSASREEGRTTVALNLALALSGNKDKKVLLIDGDIENPRLNSLLKIENGVGLVQYLNGESAIQQAIVDTDYLNLSLMPLGSKGVAMKAGDVEFDRMKSLAEEVKREFDYVILDAPSCRFSSAPMLMAPFFDYTLFVVRAGATEREVIAQALERFKRVESNIAQDSRYSAAALQSNVALRIGVVVNCQKEYMPAFIQKWV